MRKWIWVFLAALIVGCGPQADQPADTIATGPWRGEIDHFGRTLPFNMELRQGPEGLEAVFRDNMVEDFSCLELKALFDGIR